MEDVKKQQVEALEAAYDYIKKLDSSIITVLDELRIEKKEDTKEFLDQIINGVNWVIEVTNGTLSLLNQEKQRIDKDAVNQQVAQLGAAIKAKDDLGVAESLEKGILPFLSDLKAAAMEVAAIQEN